MTFGAIKTRIADEMMRPDLASQIGLAVNDAINEAAGTRFWFNEVRGLTFTLTAGNPFYAAADVAALSKIDTLWLTINTQRRIVDPVNALSIADWDDGQNGPTGEPHAYTRQADGLVFWMPPRLAYSGGIDGVTRFAALSDDADTNPYLVEGELYIRALAKAFVWENVVRDFDEADRQWQLAERNKRILLAETASRLATNTNLPHL